MNNLTLVYLIPQAKNKLCMSQTPFQEKPSQPSQGPAMENSHGL